MTRTLLLSLLLLGAPVAQAPIRVPVLRQMQAAVEDAMRAQDIPGLSVAVGRGDTLRWTQGFGFADLENSVPATAETVYRLASISKPITAVAVLQPAQAHKLDLDHPVQDWVPDFPAKPWPLTVRQLLCHQSGIRHYRPGEILSAKHYTKLHDGLAVFANDPLLHEPGTAMHYSTYGYCLLGCVVEGASGEPFATWVQQHVFAPAGMASTMLDDAERIIPHRAQGYRRGDDGELRNSAMVDTSNKVPGGGLCGTAADLVRFAIAVYQDRLLEPAWRERMWTAQALADGKPTGYGLGWGVSEVDGEPVVQHSGGQPRVSTLLWVEPRRKVAVALMCNLEGAKLGALARRLTELGRSER